MGRIVLLTVALARLGAASSLSLATVAGAWGPPSSSAPVPAARSTLHAPSLRLSGAAVRDANAVYAPRDPSAIPAGFARACGRAGGFAPRGLWDDLTNGVTPWFESRDGCFVYFDAHNAHWYVDDAAGLPLWLASPAGSLLLPPTDGWVSLTGQRSGAPKMSFVREALLSV